MRIVTAPCVVVVDDEGARHHLYNGASVPSYVRGEQWSRLHDLGMVGYIELVAVEEPVVIVEGVPVSDPPTVEDAVESEAPDVPVVEVTPDLAPGFAPVDEMTMEPEPVPEKSQPRRR